MKVPVSKSIFLGQIVNGFLSFAGLAIWARNAHPSAISSALIAGSFCLLLSDLVDFGGNGWINREASQRNSSLVIVWRFLIPKIKLLFVLSGLMLVYSLVVVDDYLLGIYLLITPCYLLSAAYFQGMNLVRNVFFAGFFAQFLERFFWLSPAYLILLGLSPKESIFIGLIVGQAASLIYMSLSFSRVYKIDCESNPVKYSLRETYQLSSKVGLASTISDLYSLDTFLVSRFSSLTVAGDFAVIQKNRNVSVLGFSIVASRLRLRVFENKRAVYKFLKAEFSLLVFNLLGILFVIILAPAILDFVFGQKYVSLAPALRIACISFFFLGVISVMQAILSSMRDDTFLSYFTVSTVFVSLIAIAIGAYFFDTFGACLGLTLSFMIQTLVLTVRIRERVRFLSNGE